jgi:hypothetical protein
MKLESNFNVGDVIYVCYDSYEDRGKYEGGQKHIVLAGPIIIDSMEMKLTHKKGQMAQSMVVYKTDAIDVGDKGFFTEDQVFCNTNNAFDQFKSLLRNI